MDTNTFEIKDCYSGCERIHDNILDKCPLFLINQTRSGCGTARGGEGMHRHKRILASAETPILEARIEAPDLRSFLMASSPMDEATQPSMMTRTWGAMEQGSAWLPSSWMLPSCWQAKTPNLLFFVLLLLLLLLLFRCPPRFATRQSSGRRWG